ncbi:trans-aconitate 3-methyltransferase [Marchantia polymorpha subsp. ruderalis]|uniref:Methyltransferase type 11 domain-containing protein n=1 Tax=Marchantia polymorpha TaxID=3197 RepID=A0A2R6X7T9_MARPO|nr:hypothetical protein MARPO_0031s0141 [Marchantia polymorpha]BBN01126.1 hypothetical protein Mp_2g04860 [Marchantia polymorpha subsp. ruderalis]|eukprot:PTQ42175.1 hypothetical protein MARPO_0031s0141 [Marchantia polymorpha]
MARTELFVKQAAAYARARPNYPATLFQMLADATQRHERAWDCATGNGQAAAMLAEHYESVVATDISDGQLAHAVAHPRVTYRKMLAVPEDSQELEHTVGPAGSVDLVTVAQAVHWFDLPAFYSVVRHVLRRPGGVLAVWCYKQPRVSAAVDALCDKLYEHDSAQYWDPARELVDADYRTIPFPFEPVDSRGVGPHFMSMTKEWTLDDYLHYWRSNSAIQTALDNGVDLLSAEVCDTFLRAWGPADISRTVTFPMALLMGTVSASS